MGHQPDKNAKMITLLDLRRALKFVGYDSLNLYHLDPLRSEVQGRIDQLIADSKTQQPQPQPENPG